MPLIDVPYISQEGLDARGFANDCGSACTAMLLRWKGLAPGVTVDQLSREAGLPRLGGGLSPANLVSLAARHGLALLVHSNTTLADIRAEIDQGRPVIALIAYRDISSRQNVADKVPGLDGHFVVICGYDGDKFVVNDPDRWGNRTPEGHFLAILAAEIDRALTDMGYGRQCVFVAGEQPLPLVGAAVVADGPLNVRAAPGGTIISQLPTGAVVTVVESAGGWSRITVEAFVATPYLRKV